MLDIIKTVGEWFTALFEKVSRYINFPNVAIFMAGIFIGLVLAGCLYCLMLFLSIKNNKKIKEIQLSNVTDEEMIDLVEQTKKEFVKNNKGLSSLEKSKHLGHTIKELINKIAAFYFPKSKHPIYELTISELLNLLTYINNRINDILDKPIFKPFKSLSISQIVKIVETRKKASDSKMVKVASTARKISKIGFTVVNYANPYYWLKRLVFSKAISYTINKISLITIDIVADETNKVYSKRLFNVEDNGLNKHIEENLQKIEEEILKENKNE